MKIAFVTPWKEKSSISAYAGELLPRIATQFSDHHIFAEHLDEAPVEPNVTRCWHRGESLEDLVTHLTAYRPDAVYIEHQYGLFYDQDEWLDLLGNLRGAKVFVKMHCVYASPMAVMTNQKQGVGSYESLDYTNAMGNIIVHTHQAAGILKARGVKAPVSVIPHGFPSYMPMTQVSSTPKIFSFGFGLKYKGLENSVAIVKNLLPQFPDLLYIGAFGDEPRRSLSSAHYFAEIKKLIDNESMDKNFLLFRGYKDLPTLQKFAQQCTLALFPYIKSHPDREVYGSSGAVRTAMSWGLPVVTSKTPLFSDLDGVVLQGETVSDMQNHVRHLCASQQLRQIHSEWQRHYVERNSWDTIADLHIKLFQSS